MRIRVNKLMYNNYNEFRNIEYELEWILGYIEKKNFYEDILSNIELKGEMVEYLVSKDVLKLLEKNFSVYKSGYKVEDIEKIINVLYTILHSLGGTN